MKEKNLLLIFVRNPVLGKCKTRLAATIGDFAALEVYTFLLNHTSSITKELLVTKEVHYSEKPTKNDLWDSSVFVKKQQVGKDLGDRMKNAFKNGFENGFENVIIIGSDLFDLTQSDLEQAFLELETHDVVVGPAKDGGYYLLGMKSINSPVFKNKAWGTNTVLEATLLDLKENKIKLLEERNDVDNYEDIKDVPVFQQFYTEQ